MPNIFLISKSSNLLVAGSEAHASAFREKCLARPAIFFMPENDEEKQDEVKNYLEDEARLKIGIRNKLRNTFFTFYTPVYDPRDAQFHFSTAMIYQKCQKLVTNALLYSTTDIELWLHEAGFTWFDYGEMDFEWMLKKA